MPEAGGKKTCFVVMGFGKKTDFEQQRVLDLDKTYRIIIKKAVEEAGLECIRADDIVHSGIIDKPMYEYLLEADVVVADLSTSNANAIYELGVRHALRPNTTIVIAESKFKFPFDVKSLLIRPYTHLGEGIDAEDAEQVRDELVKALKALVGQIEPDSPVYTFLPDLKQPTRGGAQTAAEATPHETPAPDNTASMLMELARKARTAGKWAQARTYLEELNEQMPNDPYVIQQRALATYKAKEPDVLASLLEARRLLQHLNPESSNDTETLGLWGAVHKRLWEEGGEREHLEQAIRGHEKGFYLRDDHYNGINLAFLLNVRASISEGRDAVTDFVTAERIRKRVIEICEKSLQAGIVDDDGKPDAGEIFWLKATRVEALFGTGDAKRAEELKAEAVAEPPETWMPDSLNEQLEKLEKLLQNPPG